MATKKVIPENRPDLLWKKYAVNMGWEISLDTFDEINKRKTPQFPLTFLRGEESICAIIKDGVIQWSYSENYECIEKFKSDIRLDLKELLDAHTEPTEYI